jgi:hypothetical protein
VLTIPPAIMAVFLMLALVPDIGLRGRKYSPEREARMAEGVKTEAADATHQVEPEAGEPTPAAH